MFSSSAITANGINRRCVLRVRSIEMYAINMRVRLRIHIKCVNLI